MAAAGGKGPTIFLSAGEPSGDLHGAALARALRARVPSVRLIGLGGSRMAAEGVELLAGVDELAVMGFVEVLSRLPFFIRLQRRVHASLEREAVDLVIPIDYPGFNLRLTRHAHGAGIPVLYYIAPQVWAWHRSRAAALARNADHISVILPFEEDFLRSQGASVEFVGHPLLDVETQPVECAEWKARLGLDPRRPVLALFPGSRQQEIERHLEVFSRAAALVLQEHPEVQPVIAASPDVHRSAYAAAEWPLADEAKELLACSRAAIVKSGTSTLEAALAGVPFVVAYRVNPVTYRVARRLVRVPHIALANLVAGRRVVPELVQDDANPEALAGAVLPLLGETPERQAMVAGLAEVRERLGRGGAAERVAASAAELLGL